MDFTSLISTIIMCFHYHLQHLPKVRRDGGKSQQYPANCRRAGTFAELFNPGP